jgi:hypothetical protein
MTLLYSEVNKPGLKSCLCGMLVGIHCLMLVTTLFQLHGL